MRKPTGKLVALLAGAVVVVLVAVGVMFRKDVYCHLFLDPELVGRWTSQVHGAGIEIKFDRLGNMRTNVVLLPIGMLGDVKKPTYATYRIDGASLIVTSPERGKKVRIYSIEGDSLTFGSPDESYRRVPDD